MVGGDVGILVVLMQFWFRLVNKVGIVIGSGLTRPSKMKVMSEESPDVVYSYIIFKRNDRAGTMGMSIII